MTDSRRAAELPPARTVGPVRTATTGAFRLASAIAIFSAAPVGCGQTTSPIVIVGVTPTYAYSDRPVVLRIDAGSIRPALRVNVAKGGLTADVASLMVTLLSESDGALPPIRLDTLEWDGVDFSLWARAPSDLAAGPYALEIVDQHGQSGRLAGAFEGLGPDPAPPTIELPSLVDGPYVGAGSDARIEIVADDGLGAVETIHWTTSDGDVGDCPPPKPGDAPPDIRDPPHSRLTCFASFVAPALDETQPALVPFSLLVTAQDTSGQQTTLDTALFRAKPPRIDSFAETVGSLGGYQPFVVRGRNFLPGSRALLGGVPIAAMSPGGDRQGDHVLVGWTPPRGRAEPVTVEVQSPAGLALATAKFTYVSPPRVRDVQPPVGPARGGIRVTVRGNDLRPGVVVYVGATRDARQPLYNVTYDAQTKVSGCLPPGTGTVSLWAYDPLTGDGELPMAFSYQGDGATPPPDASCQVPAR